MDIFGVIILPAIWDKEMCMSWCHIYGKRPRTQVFWMFLFVYCLDVLRPFCYLRLSEIELSPHPRFFQKFNILYKIQPRPSFMPLRAPLPTPLELLPPWGAPNFTCFSAPKAVLSALFPLPPHTDLGLDSILSLIYTQLLTDHCFHSRIRVFIHLITHSFIHSSPRGWSPRCPQGNWLTNIPMIVSIPSLSCFPTPPWMSPPQWISCSLILISGSGSTHTKAVGKMSLLELTTSMSPKVTCDHAFGTSRKGPKIPMIPLASHILRYKNRYFLKDAFFPLLLQRNTSHIHYSCYKLNVCGSPAIQML
jgi:hypothetical protein